VLTEWDEFRNPDWSKLAKSVAHPLVIDGRNLYSAQEAATHGFHYVGIGRLPAASFEHSRTAAHRPPAAVPGPGIAPVSPSLAVSAQAQP
jgi:hypothetical protein